jgi:CRISPR-associated endoribonuclease Cas6
MRLNLTLSSNTELVPFDYQHFLTGAFHKWVGWNTVHGDISLYSLSWLQGAQRQGNGLSFSRGACWSISTYDIDLLKQTIKGIMENPTVCCGMSVIDIQVQEPPSFSSRERFIVASPVLARKFDGTSLRHLLYNDPEVNDVLTATLHTKLQKAGIESEARVQFDSHYPSPKTKLVTIKGIQNRANFCPVIVEGSPEVVAFAWSVGIGHLTGSGFGSLR